MGIGKLRAIKIWRSDYEPALNGDDVTTNAALDLSLWFSVTDSINAYVRGEAFMHYLAGFEPMAYNRRTARLPIRASLWAAVHWPRGCRPIAST